VADGPFAGEMRKRAVVSGRWRMRIFFMSQYRDCRNNRPPVKLHLQQMQDGILQVEKNCFGQNEK
jgi:hypothetical protein